MPLHRYILNVSHLWSEPESFSSDLSILPPDTRQKVTKFIYPTDRALSLGSGLLQRYIFCLPSLSTPPFPHISRVPIVPSPTTHRPSLVLPSSSPSFQTKIKDYNTSHHNPRESPAGKDEKTLVAIVASEHGRVGVDVVGSQCRGDPKEYIDTFDDDCMGAFTKLERQTIRRDENGMERSVDDGVRMLMVLWGLKEAYVKAIGTGIVDDLLKVEFRNVRLWHIGDTAGSRGENGRGRRKWTDEVRLFVNGVDVTEKWYMEVTLVPGVAEDFYVVVCAERGEGFNDATEKAGDWTELDYERDIKPFVG